MHIYPPFFSPSSTQCLPEQVRNKPTQLFTACVQDKHNPDFHMIVINNLGINISFIKFLGDKLSAFKTKCGEM